MAKLTEAQRQVLDLEVLRALSTRCAVMTYVIRNVVDWPGRPLHQAGVDTPSVLRACRRLVKRGHVEAGRSPYLTQKAWQITDTGRAALERPDI